MLAAGRLGVCMCIREREDMQIHMPGAPTPRHAKRALCFCLTLLAHVLCILQPVLFDAKFREGKGTLRRSNGLQNILLGQSGPFAVLPREFLANERRSLFIAKGMGGAKSLSRLLCTPWACSHCLIVGCILASRTVLLGKPRLSR